MISRILRGLAPIAALAMGASLSGCGSADLKINGEEGVPLAELDLAGPAPTELVVTADTKVIVTEGDALSIEVENDPANALRFVLDDETLGVTRDENIKFSDGSPTVRVTMPAPSSIVIVAAGTVDAATMASKADLAIGGSGSINVTNFAAESVSIAIGGSGSVTGAGTTDRLEIAIGGSGKVEMPDLKADRAEIAMGGSGNVSFASDGDVEANIGGAGDINVTGDAKCTLSSFGSGTLNCTPAAKSDTSEPTEETAVTEES